MLPRHNKFLTSKNKRKVNWLNHKFRTNEEDWTKKKGEGTNVVVLHNNVLSVEFRHGGSLKV